MNLAVNVAEAATSANDIIQKAAQGAWKEPADVRLDSDPLTAFEYAIASAFALFKSIHQTGSLHGRTRRFSPAEIKLEADLIALIEDRNKPELSMLVKSYAANFIGYEKALQGNEDVIDKKTRPRVIRKRRARRKLKIERNQKPIVLLKTIGSFLTLFLVFYAAAHYDLLGAQTSRHVHVWEQSAGSVLRSAVSRLFIKPVPEPTVSRLP